jgi:hypothetical protein
MNTFNQRIYCDRKYWKRPTLSYCRLNWIQTPTPRQIGRLYVLHREKKDKEKSKDGLRSGWDGGDWSQ